MVDFILVLYYNLLLSISKIDQSFKYYTSQPDRIWKEMPWLKVPTESCKRPIGRSVTLYSSNTELLFQVLLFPNLVGKAKSAFGEDHLSLCPGFVRDGGRGQVWIWHQLRLLLTYVEFPNRICDIHVAQIYSQSSQRSQSSQSEKRVFFALLIWAQAS